MMDPPLTEERRSVVRCEHDKSILRKPQFVELV